MTAFEKLVITVAALGLPAMAAPADTGRVQTATAASPAVMARPAGLAEGVREAMAVHVVKPVYPSTAPNAPLAGLVEVRATIGKDGRVLKAHAVSGPAALRVAAEDALKQWRYAPTLLNGQPVASQAVVEFRFGADE